MHSLINIQHCGPPCCEEIYDCIHQGRNFCRRIRCVSVVCLWEKVKDGGGRGDERDDRAVWWDVYRTTRTSMLLFKHHPHKHVLQKLSANITKNISLLLNTSHIYWYFLCSTFFYFCKSLKRNNKQLSILTKKKKKVISSSKCYTLVWNSQTNILLWIKLLRIHF